MTSLDDEQTDRYIDFGHKIGFEAAVYESLNFHLKVLAAFVARYPWLWDYGDGRGGAIFFGLEEHLSRLGFSRTPEPDANRERHKRKPLRTAHVIAAMQRSGGRCVVCGDENNLEVDHIHPVSRGGTNDPDNLQMLCKQCNMSKGPKTMAEWKGGAA